MSLCTNTARIQSHYPNTSLETLLLHHPSTSQTQAHIIQLCIETPAMDKSCPRVATLSGTMEYRQCEALGGESWVWKRRF